MPLTDADHALLRRVFGLQTATPQPPAPPKPPSHQHHTAAPPTKYSAAAKHAAVDAVHSNGAVRSTAAALGLPKSTLSDWVADCDGTATERAEVPQSSPGRPPVLSFAEERELKHWALTRRGGTTIRQLLQEAKHRHPTAACGFTIGWADRFRTRHRLSLRHPLHHARRPEHLKHLVRNIQNFWRDIRDDHALHHFRSCFNADEVKVFFEPGNPKVLCDASNRSVTIACGSHTKDGCTVLLTVTRDGKLLAPFVVFAGQNQMKVEHTSKTLYPAMVHFQKNAFMTGALWCQYLEFVSRALPRPTLAVFDIFSGHITPDALELMQQKLKHFHYQLVPAHATPFVQPLDVLINRSWKAAFRRRMQQAIDAGAPTGAVEWRELVLRVVEETTDEIRDGHVDQLRRAFVETGIDAALGGAHTTVTIDDAALNTEQVLAKANDDDEEDDDGAVLHDDATDQKHGHGLDPTPKQPDGAGAAAPSSSADAPAKPKPKSKSAAAAAAPKPKVKRGKRTTDAEQNASALNASWRTAANHDLDQPKPGADADADAATAPRARARPAKAKGKRKGKGKRCRCPGVLQTVCVSEDSDEDNVSAPTEPTAAQMYGAAAGSDDDDVPLEVLRGAKSAKSIAPTPASEVAVGAAPPAAAAAAASSSSGDPSTACSAAHDPSTKPQSVSVGAKRTADVDGAAAADAPAAKRAKGTGVWKQYDTAPALDPRASRNPIDTQLFVCDVCSRHYYTRSQLHAHWRHKPEHRSPPSPPPTAAADGDGIAPQPPPSADS